MVQEVIHTLHILVHIFNLEMFNMLLIYQELIQLQELLFMMVSLG